MKSVLYVGATLMIGASIYGFVDYKHTQNKKEFKEMYTVAKKPPAEPAIENLPALKEEKPAAIKKTGISETNKKAKASAAKKAQKKTKKKRVFEARLFSRGGLDESYIKPSIEKTDPLPVEAVIKEK